MRIGIDILGGDFVPHAPLDGAILAQETLTDCPELVLVGPPDVIEAQLRARGVALDRFTILPATDSIAMKAHPAKAVVAQPDASIPLGVRGIQAGQLDAFVTAGNTGATVVAAVMLLGMVAGFQRPVLAALYPTGSGVSMLCDVGANVDCKPELLHQFGIIGSVYMHAALGVAHPRVALLNIGEEPSKGTAAAQAAYAMLEADSHLNFVGNAEGRDMLAGKADVFVCDGYTGNIVLKYAESFYPILKQYAPHDPGVEAYNYEAIGGLPALGVNGTVIIGHGISSPQAFVSMIRQAQSCVAAQLPQALATALAAPKT